MRALTFGSLFAGIGGFDLGLERAGMECRWQVEIDPWCRQVLAKHWPGVPRWDDVRTFARDEIERLRVDVVCGGFPCQDLSRAGKRAGIEGVRSGLWSEMCRVVRILRPKFIVVENVAAILDGGFGRVVGDMAAIGYDAEWDCLPACAFGAPHVRDRLFIVGHPVPVADVLHADGERCAEQYLPAVASRSRILDRPVAAAWVHGWHRPPGTEPVVRRVADGIPDRVDRLRGLGNAVVPAAAEWIGRRVIASLGSAHPC